MTYIKTKILNLGDAMIALIANINAINCDVKFMNITIIRVIEACVSTNIYMMHNMVAIAILGNMKINMHMIYAR